MSNRETLLKAVEDFYESRARAHIEDHLNHIHPECYYRIVGTDRLGPFTQAAATPESIRAAAQATFDAWDMSGLRIVTFNTDGDTAFIHRSGRVRFIPDDSKSLDTELMDKITFKDGKVVEYLQFVDTYAVAKVIGLA